MYRSAWMVFAAALVVFAADINEELLAAARKGDLISVKSLLEKGAALETQTAYGQTPLYVAAMSGHEEVVRFLLEKGAKTDVRDTFYKSSVLGFVISRKHYAVAKLLIAKGTSTADQNLEAVARTGNADLVQAVLEKGKPSQSTLDQNYEMALERKQTEVAELLKKAGAQPPAPPVDVDAKVLESYTGTYKSEQFPLEVKILVKDGKLYMQATGQPEIAPKPKSPTIFGFAPAQMEVEFDSAGSFTLRQRGMTIKFKKVVTP